MVLRQWIGSKSSMPLKVRMDTLEEKLDKLQVLLGVFTLFFSCVLSFSPLCFVRVFLFFFTFLFERFRVRVPSDLRDCSHAPAVLDCLPAQSSRWQSTLYVYVAPWSDFPISPSWLSVKLIKVDFGRS